MKTAAKLDQEVPIRKVGTTKRHILDISHPVEDMVSQAAVRALDRLTGSGRISLQQGMASMNGEIIEGLVTTLVEMDNASVGRLGRKTRGFTLETDSEKAIENMDDCITDPRRKMGVPCTKGIIIAKCLQRRDKDTPGVTVRDNTTMPRGKGGTCRENGKVAQEMTVVLGIVGLVKAREIQTAVQKPDFIGHRMVENMTIIGTGGEPRRYQARIIVNDKVEGLRVMVEVRPRCALDRSWGATSRK
jgi:hypothetical protein